MSVVGVDLGNKNAVIAAAGRGGVDVILNGNSNRQNPSLISFGSHRTMGENASSSAMSNYKNTISSMKRLVGLSFDDVRAQTEIARAHGYTCVKNESTGGVSVKVMLSNEQRIIPIECVVGMMVGHMGEIARSNNEGVAPQDWVVAVPPFYTDAQRRMFLKGCEVSGVNIQRLIHENTASALAYGIFKDVRKEFVADKPTSVMFIDLGQSAYTVSIVAFEPGKLTAKSCHYDMDLGGRDFDTVIAHWIGKSFCEKHRGVQNPMDHPKARLKVLAAAEKLKKTLSPAGVKEGRVGLECLLEDRDFFGTLKTEDYENMCAPLLHRLEAPLRRALSEANLSPSDMSSIEIVGGSSRIACVKRTLAGLLGLDKNAINFGLSTTLNADESVARGAALMSAILSPRFKVLPYEIVESQPVPVRVSWDGSATGEEQGSGPGQDSVVMFERGSNFPCVRRVTLRRKGQFYVRAAYDQEGDFLTVGAPRDITEFTIMAPEGEPVKVRVNVKADIHGIITLSSAQMVEEVEDEMDVDKPAENGEEAKAPEGETEAKKKRVKKTNLEFKVNYPLDWTKTQLDELVEKEVSMANTDRIVRETSDARNALESYIYDMRDKIHSSLSKYCTDVERDTLSRDLESSENWLYEDGFDTVKSVYLSKLADLKKIGYPIEERESEERSRPEAFKHLKSVIDKYMAFLSSNDVKYEHITPEEKSNCRSKCEEMSNWMYTTMEKQGDLAQNANPCVKSVDIMARSRELQTVCNPIMTKRPPPPPKETKKPEEKPEEKPAKAKDETETMDVDTPVEPPPEVEIDSEVNSS
mmetsp:Transcript_16759/g.37682  ORF Transcript_16759/g.37682 Transcript_16759/m.37682 type:complete len:809 (-) Transcript_16759:229-2655(-)